MKRYVWLFTIVAFFLLAAFVFQRCNNNGSNGGGTLTVTLTPGKATTIVYGQITATFPAGAVTQTTTCTVQIMHNKSLLPSNIAPASDIYSVSLANPDVYDVEENGHITFTIADPIQYSVFANYTKYAGQGPQWYEIGGVISGNTIGIPIPQYPNLFVVGTNISDLTAGPADTHMRKGPFLMLDNKPGSMIVQWEAYPGISPTATLSWGFTPNSNPDQYPYQTQVTADANLFFSQEIDSLTPAARTYYAVTISQGTAGTTYTYQGSFLAPPPENFTTVTFYALGDTRSYPIDFNRVLLYLNQDSKIAPDTRQTFILHSGDFCSRGLMETRWDGEFFFYRKLNSINDVLATFPIMGTHGNHEFYKNVNGSPEYLPPAALFRYYWNYPMYQDSATYHYSFDYGPVHVVSIDLYDEQYNPGSAQYQWLINDLLGSSKPWKIVLFHHPAYCANKSGKDDGYCNGDDIRSYLSPIFEDPKYGVSLVIQGHVHNYARSIHNGLNYITVGGGGAPRVPPDSNQPFTVTATEQYCFARITAGPTDMRVTVLNANDTSFLQQIDYVDILRP